MSTSIGEPTVSNGTADVRSRVTHVRAWLATPRGLDVTAVALFVLGALFVTGRVWLDPNGRLQAANLQDHVFFEWVLGHAQWSVAHLSSPLFSDRLNVPAGVNMMANTSILALAIPLVPITALFGPGVSYAVLLNVGFAATAGTWYWLLSRHVVRSRPVALIGGAFCGFAPGMVSQGNGHPNLVAQFVVPLIIWRVLKLREPGRALRNGVALGALVTLQAFINEELLLFTAIGCAVFLAAHAVQQRAAVRASVRPMIAGLAVTAGFAGILLAYPLAFQFFGPQHYRGVPIYTYQFRTDLASYWSFATESISGTGIGTSPYAVHAAEENTFYGWPLLLFLVAAVWITRRRPAAMATTITGLFFAVLTLGRTVFVAGRDTHIPGPWMLFERLPLFDSVVPARLSLAVIPCVGVLIAMAIDEILSVAATPQAAALPVRSLLAIAVIGALLPIAPTPLPTQRIPPTPSFIADGTWRQYLSGDQTMVTVPPSSNYSLYGQQWSAEQGLEIALGQGYFLGPGGPDGRATYPALPTPTSTLLDKVADSGLVADVGLDDVEAAHRDLIRWRAAIVVLGPGPNEDALLLTVSQLLGPGRRIGGVWVWDIRNAAWQTNGE